MFMGCLWDVYGGLMVVFADMRIGYAKLGFQS